MKQVPSASPPFPWSPRMQAAAEVRNAYLELDDRIQTQLDELEDMRQYRTLIHQKAAAQLQVEAAHKTMWIIHEEEQKG